MQTMHLIRHAGIAFAAFAASAAMACDEDSTPVFSCEAAQGRKFIELCAPAPPSRNGYLEYRFGTLDRDGREQQAELLFPARCEGSLAQFRAATYTHNGAYTQSVRFETTTHSYTVFTRVRGQRDEGVGVDVKALATGKVTTVFCSERPRFYIFDLKNLVACDPQTPAGMACIH